MTKPSVYLRTFGCQMNVRDSEFVTGLLLEHGFKAVDSAEKAGVALFNSCSVRKHAEDRLFSNIAELKELKERRPGLLVGLIGCTAQLYKDKALRRSALIDFVCGPGNEHELPQIIRKAMDGRQAVIAVDKVNKARPELSPKFRNDGPLAYVSISEGCDNFCSYCIVPYVRGRERSRGAKDIIREVRELAERGFKEVMLLGQNVNSYKGARGLPAGRQGKGQGAGFVRLLEELNEVKGLRLIRFMTSHPKDAGAELFRAIGSLDKVSKRLHLPVQSGSDRILKLMNRGYTRKRYLKLIETYRNYVTGGEVTTDIIVGFPSETGKDFKDTVSLMKKADFSGAYIYKYSPRPPARSSRLKDDVPPQEKQRRLAYILDMQRKAAHEKRGKDESRPVA